MPETKTPEEILGRHDLGHVFTEYFSKATALSKMTEYASQQSRSTAIGFAEWVGGSRWIPYPEIEGQQEQMWYCPSGDINTPDEEITCVQLYNLFLEHLRSLTNQKGE